MKCENCGKNEVSFVYRSSINGKTEEHHLCQACAEKLGYTQKLFARRPSMVDSRCRRKPERRRRTIS